jgi:hypothetical protein
VDLLVDRDDSVDSLGRDGLLLDDRLDVLMDMVVAARKTGEGQGNQLRVVGKGPSRTRGERDLHMLVDRDTHVSSRPLGLGDS